MAGLFGPEDGIVRSATFSPDDVYRYTLERVWDEHLSRLLWILLNPSTADAVRDDPTNRKGIKFSKAWAYGSCVFANLFGFRSPHPSVMKAFELPVGPDNDHHILAQVKRADTIVVAWGNDGRHRGRDAEVLKLLKHRDLWCMGLNKNGTPRHPLYLRDSTPLQLYMAGA